MGWRCPKCESAELSYDGRCSLCGSAVAKTNSFMIRAYALTGGLAFSVFTYALVAYVVLSSGNFRPQPGVLPAYAVHTLVVIGGISALAGFMVARRGVGRFVEPQRLLGSILLGAVLCEAPAALGLALALLTGQVFWMVALLACSLTGFLGIAMEMPAYAQLVAAYVEAHGGPAALSEEDEETRDNDS